MIKTKIVRAKTQKKENRRILPQLKPGKRLMTLMGFFDGNVSQNRKMSDSSNVKQISAKDHVQIKRIVDQNYVQVSTGKNSVKYSKKRLTNQFMMIQQIGTTNSLGTKIANSSNLLDFGADQYQGQRQYNQDRILMSVNVRILGKIYNFFGVFDGHGGYSAAEYAKINFVKFFEDNMNANPMLTTLENLRKTINKIQVKICEMAKGKAIPGGGTCASVVIMCENNYYIAHVGDSRVIIVKKNDNSYEHQQITTDHKPENKNQKVRIESVGGKVYRNKITVPKENTESFGPYRVLPGKLSVSRSLGDYDIKKQPCGQAISWQPELLQGKISQKCLFLLYTDGAYEKFENSQIVEHFIKTKSIEDIEIRKSIQSFLINSILRESSDNISLAAVTAKPY